MQEGGPNPDLQSKIQQCVGFMPTDTYHQLGTIHLNLNDIAQNCRQNYSNSDLSDEQYHSAEAETVNYVLQGVSSLASHIVDAANAFHSVLDTQMEDLTNLELAVDDMTLVHFKAQTISSVVFENARVHRFI